MWRDFKLISNDFNNNKEFNLYAEHGKKQTLSFKIIIFGEDKNIKLLGINKRIIP